MKVSSLRSLASAAAVVALLGAAPAQAQIIDFEDLTSSLFVPTLFHGFTFGGGNDTGPTNESWDSSVGSNPFGGRGASSGSKFAWSNGGTRLDLSRATAFNLTSMSMVASFGQCGGQSSGGSVQQTIDAFLNNVLVDTRTVTLSCSATNDTKTLNFMNVDRISIAEYNSPFNVLVDDIVYSDAAIVAPEPSTVALMTVGLFAVGFARRRRRV